MMGGILGALRLRAQSVRPSGSARRLIVLGCLLALWGCRPDSDTPPVITGLAEVGHTLTSSQGTWKFGPTSFTYTWYSCATGGSEECMNRQGGAGSSYVVRA